MKEKELREKEFRRIRKLQMDGKIVLEDEETHQDSKSHTQISQSREREIVLYGTFQKNPAQTYRNVGAYFCMMGE